MNETIVTISVLLLHRKDLFLVCIPILALGAASKFMLAYMKCETELFFSLIRLKSNHSRIIVNETCIIGTIDYCTTGT